MKLTKQDILDLHNALHNLGELTGSRFTYAVARNLAELKKEVTALEDAYAPTQEFIAYDEKREALAKSHAIKVDDKPQTAVKNGVESYVMADEAKFEEELKALQEEYKEAIENRKKQSKDFEELLKEEVDVELYSVAIEHVPEAITAKQMKGILPIIEDSPEE